VGDRYWLWMGARLLVAVAIVAWAASYFGPGGGEKEFQKALDAVKNVHSFRVAFTSNMMDVRHNEILQEVDCTRGIFHEQQRVVQTASSISTARESNRDSLYAAGAEYERQKDGSWSRGQGIYRGDPAKGYCNSLAQGAENGLMPQFATMIKRGVLQKGDKKTVNGVRCREWLVTMKGGMSGLEHDTVCLGVDDHLPYEMTVDWEHARSVFSDYNTPLQIDLPEAALQPASATTGSK
jgi:hypothetical protein